MNNENKNTAALAIALVLCLIVLVILAICVYEKFTTSTPAVDPEIPDDKQYATVPNLKGMNLAEARAALDDAEIVYEIVHTDSDLYNKVLDVEYSGKVEGENILIELGTTVKLHANEVDPSKIIYLTFDDGPTSGNTFDILDTLDQYGAKASFFVLGDRVIQYADRIKATVERGHIVACHSYSHNLVSSSDGFIYASTDAFLSELNMFESALRGAEITLTHKILRFPGGTCTNGHLSKEESLEYITAARNAGYKVYDWTALTNDADNSYRLDGESDKDYYIRSLRESLEQSKEKGLPLIVLMHDKLATNECLADILEYLVSEGYVFDTIDHCPEYTFAEN